MPPTYFDLAARDYILADSAIELVIEVVPCSGIIRPSQSSELIFSGQSDRWEISLRFSENFGVRDDLESRPPFDFHASPLQYFSANDKDKAAALPNTHRAFNDRPRFWNRRVLCDRFPHERADRAVSQSTGIRENCGWLKCCGKIPLGKAAFRLRHCLVAWC